MIEILLKKIKSMWTFLSILHSKKTVNSFANQTNKNRSIPIIH